ncbi:MAG: bifunctional (p)ppGpp synthetase/guanosine-3',5'-bis(diphosphate) 3'-pyrophosphohydrolase [Wenzhouxiangella sp.]
MTQEREKSIEGVEKWLVEYIEHRQLSPDIVAELDTCLGGLSDTDLRRALVALEAIAPLSPDPETVLAMILLPLVLQRKSLPEKAIPSAETWPQLPDLLRQLEQLNHFGQTYLPDDSARAEGLRRLLLALVADVRVVLIALAWQLARLKQAADLDEDTRRHIARETQLIHAPLANRLGIGQLKWQLEDLAFQYLEPQAYRQIRLMLAERQSDREAYISSFMAQLRHVVSEAGIQAEISGRAKHVYSIWRKMQRKGLDFHELFDVRAVRVMVDTVAECYSVLGLVHTHWQPVPGEFDDYITNPKANLYQSLHTAVTGTKGRAVEVQIRTHDMHRHAELGVAAHWRYKEGGPRDAGLEKRIGVMRQLLEGSEEGDDQSLLEDFQNLTTEDRVYVLTPRGEVKDLAAGATPLDFAYLVHTEVGHRCRGARVNGRIVPLTTVLKNGDRVEILTGKEPRPSRDWLSPRLGYIRTARARSKVRHWFKMAHYDENLGAGRAALEAEFKRLDLDFEEAAEVLEHFNFRRVEDLCVAVGCGELGASQVAHAVERKHPERRLEAAIIPVSKPAPPRPGRGSDVQIEGVGNLMHNLAQCCQPVPGDDIAGYITRARGVSIHRQDCRQFINLQRQSPERVIQVRWAHQATGRYPARILIDAWDRRELIRDVSGLLAGENVNVTAMNASRQEDTEQVRIDLTVQVEDFDQLASLLNRMQSIPGVTTARRVRDA